MAWVLANQCSLHVFICDSNASWFASFIRWQLHTTKSKEKDREHIFVCPTELTRRQETDRHCQASCSQLFCKALVLSWL